MTQSVGSIESGPIDLQKIYLPNANKSEPFLVQRSPLSDELEYIYTTDGRDAFFSRLNDVQQSDSDLDSFVGTLNNVERDIALSIMGESQFDSATRQAVISEFVLRLASAQDDFDRAVGMVEEDIKAEAQAQADLANLLVGIAFAFVVPGIGRAITSLTNMLPINASTGAYQAALLIQAQAGNIASAIGEAGKHGAKEVISNQLSNNPRNFFNVLREGFQAGNQEILAYIRNNIISIPDYELLIYLANWDSREITADRYATQLRLKWNQYEREVLEIDEFSAHVRAAGSLEIMDISYMTLVRVQSSSGDLQLAIIEDYTHQSGIRISSRENWMRAVSPEFEPMALERARRKGEVVRTMNASDISDVPSQYR